MSQKNKWQKQCEKKLSLENLESRQLLSAVPFTANPDYTDSTAYLATNDDVAVDYTVAEDALAADVQFEDDVEQEQAVTVNANANKLAIEFAAADKEQFTVIVKGTDAAGKETTAFKSVKAAAKNIKDGIFTYNFSGKVDNKYDVTVVKGKYTAKDLAADGGTVPEDRLVGSANVTTLAPFTFVATPNTASPNSITFQQKDGKAIESVEGWTISGKFDGAKKATVYTINEDGELVDGETVTGYSVTLNDEGASVTISGLQLNTKQSFQVAWSTENAVSAFSKNLNISTTKEQKAEPIDVEAELTWDEGTDSPTGNVTVTWKGEVGSTFSISYSYSDAKGKVVTKSATNKATVNENGEGEFVVSKLQPNQKYTFSVSANKTKDYDASDFVPAETESEDGFTVTTPTTIPAPALKKVSVTDTSVTFQITNWDKMEATLQECVADSGGGQLVIAKPGDYEKDIYCASFLYEVNDEGNGAWECRNDKYTGTMEISAVKNKNIATVTISGLEANTDYNFQAIGVSWVQNDKMNYVVPAFSKALKFKTNVSANAAPTDVEASYSNENPELPGSNIDVTWQGKADLTYTIAYTYTDAKGKVVTKNATTKATTDKDGNGQFTVTKLLSNTDYTFSVSANKTKEHSASEFVPTVESITSPTIIPAPTLKKVSVTADSVTFQVTNWDKMEKALQEIDGYGEGGELFVMNTGTMPHSEDNPVWFWYGIQGEGDANWWLDEDSEFDATIEVSTVKNKNIATVTINGLQANTNYSFQMTAFNWASNDNICSVAPATSKAFKFKTTK